MLTPCSFLCLSLNYLSCSFFSHKLKWVVMDVLQDNFEYRSKSGCKVEVRLGSDLIFLVGPLVLRTGRSEAVGKSTLAQHIVQRKS